VSSLTVLAAFLRRDFRINILHRASYALRVGSTLFAFALFYYLSEVVDDAKFTADQRLSGGYFGFVAVRLGVFTILDDEALRH
jgi:hypothetical protein